MSARPISAGGPRNGRCSAPCPSCLSQCDRHTATGTLALVEAATGKEEGMSDVEQAALAQLLAEALAADAPGPDWICATDDWLTQRQDCCTVCGQRAVALRGVCGTRALAVSYTLCARCVRQDGVRRAAQVLAER